MRHALLSVLALSLAACAHPKEAVTVRTLTAPSGLLKQMEIDTVRMAHGAGAAEWSVPGFVERHLAAFGMVRSRKNVADATVLTAELPTPGYRLIARVSPRPEQFCRIDLELEKVKPDGTAQIAEKAPWWAIHALEEVAAAINTLGPPRLPPLDEARFAHLSQEAAAFAERGDDPPLTMEEYVRVPRPLDADRSDYFVPPDSDSNLTP